MLTIDKEFKELIPPLTEEEYAELERNISEFGCLDAIKVWHEPLGITDEDGNVVTTNDDESDPFFLKSEPIIIDGHNRYEICTKLNIPFQTVEMDFSDRNEAKLWMMHNQLARRNLNDAQRIIIVRKCEDAVKAKAEERQKATLKQNADTVRENFLTRTGRATKELGELAGVSHKTYEHATTVLDEAPAPVTQAMTEGKLSINKAYEVTQLEPEQQEEIAERLKNIDKEPEETNTPAKIINEVANKPFVVNNSGNNEWYTPAEYIALAKQVMGDIDLDPASCEFANNTVKAKQFYSIDDNGLEHDWFGNVWMNPPYSTSLIGKFANKLIESLPYISNAIVLVNNATETEWFKTLITESSAVCFTYGRVKFYSPDSKTSQPLQGQAFIYFGDNAKKFTEVFSEKGWCAYPA